LLALRGLPSSIYILMKRISVVALKGGVGKSSVVAGLGLALKDSGYRVGFIDIDITGSNLYSALGLGHSPKWKLDTVNERVVVPAVDGYWLLSISSYTGEEYAIMWERSHHSELTNARDRLGELLENPSKVTGEDIEVIRRELDDVLASSKWRFVSELLSDKVVTWPESLDYQIADLPPSTSNEMFSFLEQVPDLFGVFIVSQPSAIAVTGLVRTIDLLRIRQIPIIGLVANQDGFLNKHGEVEYQFLSPRVDLKQVARKASIPFLLSIPQTGDPLKLKPYFCDLANRIVEAKPVVLKDVTLTRKLKRKVVKGIVRRI